jgi:hypothetical protein
MPRPEDIGLPSDLIVYMTDDINAIADVWESAQRDLEERRRSPILRAYVHATAVLFQGFMSAMKFFLFTNYKEHFNEEDLDFLSGFHDPWAEPGERGRELDGRGKRDEGSIADQLRRTVTLLGRTFNFTADFSGEGWSAVRQTIALRTRIAHPKGLKHFAVDESVLGPCATGRDWLLGLIPQISEGDRSANRE